MSLPNQLTVLRIMLTPLFAMTLAFETLYFKYFSLFIFVLATLTDWYDGYIARKFGSVTPTGKYLDPLADKFLVVTAFGVFTYLGYVQLWMFVLIASRDVLITVLRSYAMSQGKKFETSNFAKWKTACQMLTIYAIFIWVIAKDSYAGPEAAPALLQDVERYGVIDKLMWFVTLFTVTSGVTYLVDNRKHLKSLAIAFYRVFVPTNVR